jgi:carbamoyl-phosphate synthase small subunit
MHSNAQKNGKIILENGTEFSGTSFGFPHSSAGEVVFNTGMVGYPEAFTDPSYLGQIFVSTYPLIGNYGVPRYKQKNRIPLHVESGKGQIAGLIVTDYSISHHHWDAAHSLEVWLRKEQIPALSGVDTRRLTTILRENGSMLGKIIIDADVDYYDPNKENLVASASTRQKTTYGTGKKHILLVDLGAKYNIIQMLLARDFKVTVVPWNEPFAAEAYDGIMLSNGPGDPQMCHSVIPHLERAIAKATPIFGICLGHQVLSLAAGADTYKLKYGHRGQNQPVIETGTNRCLITSQNHGYAVQNNSLPDDWEVWFRNLNDDTIEGIRHRNKPIFSVQFHPEANPGPGDSEYLFDYFADKVRGVK